MRAPKNIPTIFLGLILCFSVLAYSQDQSKEELQQPRIVAWQLFDDTSPNHKSLAAHKVLPKVYPHARLTVIGPDIPFRSEKGKNLLDTLRAALSEASPESTPFLVFSVESHGAQCYLAPDLLAYLPYEIFSKNLVEILKAHELHTGKKAKLHFILDCCYAFSIFPSLKNALQDNNGPFTDGKDLYAYDVTLFASSSENNLGYGDLAFQAMERVANINKARKICRHNGCLISSKDGPAFKAFRKTVMNHKELSFRVWSSSTQSETDVSRDSLRRWYLDAFYDKDLALKNKQDLLNSLVEHPKVLQEINPFLFDFIEQWSAELPEEIDYEKRKDNEQDDFLISIMRVMDETKAIETTSLVDRFLKAKGSAKEVFGQILCDLDIPPEEIIPWLKKMSVRDNFKNSIYFGTIRRDAIRCLAKFGNKAVPHIVQLLNSSDDSILMDARDGLRRQELPEGLSEPLVEIIQKEPSPFAIELLSMSLQKLEKTGRTYSTLKNLTHSSNPYIVYQSFLILSRFGHLDAFRSQLIQMVNNKKPKNRGLPIIAAGFLLDLKYSYVWEKNIRDSYGAILEKGDFAQKHVERLSNKGRPLFVDKILDEPWRLNKLTIPELLNKIVRWSSIRRQQVEDSLLAYIRNMVKGEKEGYPPENDRLIRFFDILEAYGPLKTNVRHEMAKHLLNFILNPDHHSGLMGLDALKLTGSYKGYEELRITNIVANKENSVTARIKAIITLSYITEKPLAAFELYERLFSNLDESPRIRSNALISMTRVAESTGKPELLDKALTSIDGYLKSEDPYERMAGIVALRVIENPSEAITTRVRKFLKEPYHMIRNQAEKFLDKSEE